MPLERAGWRMESTAGPCGFRYRLRICVISGQFRSRREAVADRSPGSAPLPARSAQRACSAPGLPSARCRASPGTCRWSPAAAEHPGQLATC